jgi:hypothetical protein
MIRTPHANAGRARRQRHVRAARVARTHGPRGRTRRLPKASHALTVRMRRAGTFPCSSAHRLFRLLSPFSSLLSVHAPLLGTAGRARPRDPEKTQWSQESPCPPRATPARLWYSANVGGAVWQLEGGWTRETRRGSRDRDRPSGCRGGRRNDAPGHVHAVAGGLRRPRTGFVRPLPAPRLRPSPLALRPSPFALRPTPYALRPTPYALRPSPPFCPRPLGFAQRRNRNASRKSCKILVASAAS